MSKYGIKIKNYEAGSLYGHYLGIRDNLDCTDAMLTNSLFSNYLISIGLNVWKEESTRDVICIEFNYGTKSYEEELKKLDKKIKDIETDFLKEKISVEDKEAQIQRIESIRERAILNQDKFKKMSAGEIRSIYYKDGVDITYQTHNKKGEIIKEETIHYKMLYRTPGKAKKGSCMFINEALYDKAHAFLYMDIELPKENSPMVEMGAYSSLITSSIVGTVKIDPKNILIVKDVDSFFQTKVISVETDENKHCQAIPVDNYKLKNTLFDGQALIDTSIFPEWADGYILLRHHLFKAAAFHTNIQLFMRDYFGAKYETATVKDMFGNEHLAKDILFITTDNALKWLKFDVSYDYWYEKVRENGCEFGIVKTAHKSKLGEVQRMSYQMINAMDMRIMPQVVQCSLDYIDKLKTDNEVFLDYLRKNSNFSNDYEVLVALVEHNPEFVRCEYFRERKWKILQAYILNFKTGKIIQNADNLVIVGSPYAMLLHAAGANPLDDDTFAVESDAIQCYTERFAEGEYLAEFRNPFNSKNNLGHLHNIYDKRLQKYFNLGQQIIAVNLIETDFQDRNNGSDQDSDSLYVTNHKEIVECAKYCYLNYPTIVNNIPKEKNSYTYSLENFAAIDNNLAAAQRAIGESSNLAQICLTYTYNYDDQKYEDYVCILSVLAQVSIDSAKRRFDIDLVEEIKRIKQDMNIKENGYPVFWKLIRPGFNNKRINPKLQCPMNYIYGLKLNKFKDSSSTLPMSYFFVKHEIDKNEKRRKSRKIEAFIQKYSLDWHNNYPKTSSKMYTDRDIEKEKILLLQSNFDKLIKDIQSIYISQNYLGLMSWLLNRAFIILPQMESNRKTLNSTMLNNRAILVKILYTTSPQSFLKCFSSSRKESRP